MPANAPACRSHPGSRGAGVGGFAMNRGCRKSSPAIPRCPSTRDPGSSGPPRGFARHPSRSRRQARETGCAASSWRARRRVSCELHELLAEILALEQRDEACGRVVDALDDRLAVLEPAFGKAGSEAGERLAVALLP